MGREQYSGLNMQADGFCGVGPTVLLCWTAFLIWPKGRPGEWSAKRDSTSRSQWHWFGPGGQPANVLGAFLERTRYAAASR
jgi:hypothetical protein